MQDLTNNKVTAKKVHLQTWGWPYVTVARDGFEYSQEGAWV